jgi:hypothetical protein
MVTWPQTQTLPPCYNEVNDVNHWPSAEIAGTRRSYRRGAFFSVLQKIRFDAVFFLSISAKAPGAQLEVVHARVTLHESLIRPGTLRDIARLYLLGRSNAPTLHIVSFTPRK